MIEVSINERILKQSIVLAPPLWCNTCRQTGKVGLVFYNDKAAYTCMHCLEVYGDYTDGLVKVWCLDDGWRSLMWCNGSDSEGDLDLYNEAVEEMEQHLQECHPAVTTARYPTLALEAIR